MRRLMGSPPALLGAFSCFDARNDSSQTARTQPVTFPERRMTTEALADLFKALSFAAYAHRAQTRKGSGEPDVNHLIEVAYLLADVAGVEDVDVLRAAVLHDVVEDTDVTAAEIERTFGARVRMLVDAVTDDNRLPKAERKRLQIE